MKKLSIGGWDLFYKIESFECGPYGGMDCHRTQFYLHKGTEKRKRYWFFGAEYDYEVYEEVFQLDFSVEDSNYTKDVIREKLNKEIERLEVLELRRIEIQKGDII